MITWQQIMDAITTRSGTILVINGYYTDLGRHVFVHLSRPLISTEHQDELPALVLRDVNDAVVQQWSGNPGQYDHHLSIEAEVVAAPGTLDMTVARQMAIDFWKMAGVDETWGGLAMRTYLDAAEPVLQKEEKVVEGVLIKFRVFYKTTRFKESL